MGEIFTFTFISFFPATNFKLVLSFLVYWYDFLSVFAIFLNTSYIWDTSCFWIQLKANNLRCFLYYMPKFNKNLWYNGLERANQLCLGEQINLRVCVWRLQKLRPRKSQFFFLCYGPVHTLDTFSVLKVQYFNGDFKKAVNMRHLWCS